MLLSAIWGSSFLFMRLAVLDFGPLPTAGVRVAVAALVLLPLVWTRGQLSLLLPNWQQVFIMGVLNSAIPFACYTFALQAISTGLSAILNATTPLFGALVAWAWLRDRPGGIRVAGLLLGFAGVAALAWDKASFQPNASGVAPAWAVLACLLATLCYGIAANFARRHMQGVPPLVSATGSQLGATAALALPTLWLWPTATPGPNAWAAVTVAGVLCTGIAYILYFRLITQAGPTKALAVTFMVPVFAVVFGAVFLGEALTGWMALCGAVIVLGTGMSTGLVSGPITGWKRRGS
jgi:drug/metabolite transporter (DMT)-like permease